MANGKIVLKIRDGNFEAEGVGFKGKGCQDKMAFLQKLGQVTNKKDKAGEDPSPAPHVNIKTR